MLNIMRPPNCRCHIIVTETLKLHIIGVKKLYSVGATRLWHHSAMLNITTPSCKRFIMLLTIHRKHVTNNRPSQGSFSCREMSSKLRFSVSHPGQTFSCTDEESGKHFFFILKARRSGRRQAEQSPTLRHFKAGRIIRMCLQT